MRDEDLEIAIKVVVVGNGAVGKSSMIQRYCKGIFTNEYKKTIGVDFLEKQIQVKGEDVRLMLWDTAGQEEFDAITKAYYRGAQACVIVFSTTDRASFKAVESWKKKVENECGCIPTALVQNKIDLMDQATVHKEEVEDLAKRVRLRLFKASVKEGYNVNEVFRYLCERYIDSMNSPVEDIISKRNAFDLNMMTNNLRNSHLLKPSIDHNNGTIALHKQRKLKSARKSIMRNCRIL